MRFVRYPLALIAGCIVLFSIAYTKPIAPSTILSTFLSSTKPMNLRQAFDRLARSRAGCILERFVHRSKPFVHVS